MQNVTLLKMLLQKASHYHPLHGDRLANHLPMVLVASSYLGASDSELKALFNDSISDLDYLDITADTVNIHSISQYLGDRSKYLAYLKFFNAQIAISGSATVLRNSLPALMPGIAASAFHALIRLAYAIETNNENEIAIALAFWSTEYQTFELCPKTTTDSLAVILAKVAPIGVNHTYSPGIIVDRMAEIATILNHSMQLYRPESLNFTDIRKICLQAFYVQNDFTLLHTVTGCHAFSIIMPYIQNMDFALKEFWQAIVVAYLSTGLPFNILQNDGLSKQCDFNPIILKALSSTDAHVIKLVYSCLNEYSKEKDELYYLIAERSISSI